MYDSKFFEISLHFLNKFDVCKKLSKDEICTLGVNISNLLKKVYLLTLKEDFTSDEVALKKIRNFISDNMNIPLLLENKDIHVNFLLTEYLKKGVVKYDCNTGYIYFYLNT